MLFCLPDKVTHTSLLHEPQIFTCLQKVEHFLNSCKALFTQDTYSDLPTFLTFACLHFCSQGVFRRKLKCITIMINAHNSCISQCFNALLQFRIHIMKKALGRINRNVKLSSGKFIQTLQQQRKVSCETFPSEEIEMTPCKGRWCNTVAGVV